MSIYLKEQKYINLKNNKKIKFHSPREAALWILIQVLKTGSYPVKLLAESRTWGFERRQEKFIAEITLGVLRWKGKIDWILGAFLKRKLETLPVPVQISLRIGVYELLFLEGTPPHAACSEAVELAKKYGHSGTAGLVNAVLRKASICASDVIYPWAWRKPVEFLSHYWSHPIWLVERWLERYGYRETELLLCSNNERGMLSIRANRLRISPKELKEKLQSDGHSVSNDPSGFDYLLVDDAGKIFKSEAFLQGFFSVQDSSSGLAVNLMDVEPGMRILDGCAAPGGKSIQMAEISGDNAFITALDPDDDRLSLFEQNKARLGIKNITIIPVTVEKFAETSPELFDAVLLDVPCSGLGTLRKRPDIKWKITLEQVRDFSIHQKNIINSASELVKHGGLLLYSTCTTEPEENEDVVIEFLKTNHNFILEDHPLMGSFRKSQGIAFMVPHHSGGTGSFVASLRQKL